MKILISFFLLTAFLTSLGQDTTKNQNRIYGQGIISKKEYCGDTVKIKYYVVELKYSKFNPFVKKKNRSWRTVIEITENEVKQPDFRFYKVINAKYKYDFTVRNLYILPDYGSQRGFFRVIFSDTNIFIPNVSRPSDTMFGFMINRMQWSAKPLIRKRVKITVVEVSGTAIYVKGVKWEELMWFTERSPYYKRYNELDVYMIFKLEEIKLLSPKEVSDLQVQ